MHHSYLNVRFGFNDKKDSDLQGISLYIGDFILRVSEETKKKKALKDLDDLIHQLNDIRDQIVNDK